MKKIMFVFGTRPEAIKMAPLIKEFKKHKESFSTLIAVTAQHREMLDQVLCLFNIIPDYDLNVMSKGQDLTDITTKVLIGLRQILNEEKPDLIMVHGDTTTSMAAALAAFYQKIPVAHVEAGLRTHNIYSPWPEEMNRLITSKIATYHFAPTPLSKSNLELEGVKSHKIVVTGNTVIDTLQLVNQMISSSEDLQNNIKESLYKQGFDIVRTLNGRKLVLITGHRRENFGEGFISILEAIKRLAQNFPEVDFVYPLHLNPNVREPVNLVFGKNKFQNIFFIDPVDYLPFVYLMSRAYLVLTDSGGIQEEAPGLGKPVLVMREVTERPEAVEAGTVKLVGTNYEKIVNNVTELLTNENLYKTMSQAHNPYGDGNASARIYSFINSVKL